MSDVKISALPAVTSVATTDVIPVVTGGVTSKIGSANFVNSGLSGGTANGVLYLNASKQATSGSALTFDGTNLGIGTSSPAYKLDVAGNANITGNTTLGDASTDTVTVNGYMGFGGAASSDAGITMTSSALVGAAQSGLQIRPVATSSATTSIRAVVARSDTAAASFTVTDAVNFWAAGATKGAGSTITNQHGVYIVDQTQGTNNYGITSLVSSGTNKWNIYASGTAANYFAGNLGIGTSSPGSLLQLNANNAELRLSEVNTYYGSIKVDSAGGLTIASDPSNVAANSRIIFNVDNTERARLSSDGTFRVTGAGTAGSTDAVQFSGSAPASSMSLDSYGNLHVPGGGGIASNEAFGEGALISNTTGSYNTASGSEALYSNTTGSSNTASGRYALYANTIGSSNTADGFHALRFNTTGSYNTASGFQALRLNTTGSSNTASGYGALLNSGSTVTAGSFVVGVSYTIQSIGTTDFTLIGAASNTVGLTFTATGVGSGTGTASSNTNSNTAIGYNAGSNLTSGTNNTVIGANASASSATVNNEITLGNSTQTMLRMPPVIKGYTSAAPTIASATTIAPTTPIVFVSGTTAIATITAPAPISSGGGQITIIPTGLFTTTTAGNIALATIAVVSKALIMTYDATAAKWYPSY